MKQIKCSNCNYNNSYLNTKCQNCGSFLQPRIPNINLFETIYNIIEKPKSTFHKICLSEQKNYIFLLYSFAGYGLLFTLYWFASVGLFYSNLLYLLLPAIVIGPILGISIFSLFSLLTYLISKKIFKGEASHKNIKAIVGYSLVPIVFSTIFIFPTELIVFGMYLFTNNPTPADYKPSVFYILISLDVICVFYSIILFFIGLKVANNFNMLKSIVCFFVSFLVFLTITLLPMIIIKMYLSQFI